MTKKKEHNEHTITKKQALEQLWNMGILHWKLDKNQKEMYDQVMNSPSQRFVINCSRRLGKCRKEGSLVMTKNGPVPIESLKVGDYVIGYNKDGSTSPTKVLAVECMGEKNVVDLSVGGKVIESCTPDHRFLTAQRNCPGHKERKVKDFYKGVKIKRKFYKAVCGNIAEPHAYAIGALLGDGCSTEKGTNVKISSEDNLIPEKVANVAGADYTYKSHANNHAWCQNKKAHEKIVDFNIIDKWDRKSCLNFLAGLIDTNGSVGVNGNILTIQFGSQSKVLVETFCKLVYKLWQYRVTVTKDKRSYKNGPYYRASVRNNLFSKIVLKELSKYLVLPRKKWKNKYNKLNENNSNRDYVGVKISEPYKAVTWEIQVDNDTSLYLTGDGLVTHNSYMLSLIAIEYALKNPGVRICYASFSAKAVQKIVLPIMREILSDCPPHLKPKFYKQESSFKFLHNNSIIDLAGTDAERAESLRGQNMHLGICDEAGFMDRLSYVVQDILMPMTLTTEGRIIMASTPPKTPAHDFKKYAEQAMSDNAYIHKTIYDNPRIDNDRIKIFMRETDLDGKYKEEEFDKFLEQKSGPNNSTWLREYMAEFVTDESSAVLPGFNEIVAKEITKTIAPTTQTELYDGEIKRPQFYDTYVWMDIGYDDNTGVIFGYWDFHRATLVIEDELLMHNPLPKTIAEAIQQKEFQLWGYKPVFRRVGDADPMDLAQLASMGLNNPPFSPPPRASKDTGVNMLRTMISGNRVNIHPRCTNLIDQMKNAIWNKKRDSFARSGEKFGHFDLLDCLVYASRTIIQGRDPTPPGYGIDNYTQFVVPGSQPKSSNRKALEAIIPHNRRPKK